MRKAIDLHRAKPVTEPRLRRAGFQPPVEEEIRKAQGKAGRRLKFPLLFSREPASLNLTNAEIDYLSA